MSRLTNSGDNPPLPRDIELCNYQSVCKYYPSSKCNTCKNNTYKNARKSYYLGRTSVDEGYEKLITYAIEYILDSDLREEEGWTREDIEKLERLKQGKFKIIFEE